MPLSIITATELAFLNGAVHPKERDTAVRIEYTVQIWREGEQYIAHAMPLDIASVGATPDEARQALDEAARLLLSVAREQGTLQDILEECSYRYDDGTWRSPACVAVEQRFAQLVA
jgi:predicted RNase H-like HicB family nuclease